MKKFVHWLILDRAILNDEDFTGMIEELSLLTKSKIEIYHRDSGTFESIFRVECGYSYQELPLTCNSGNTSFKRVKNKPNNIHKGVCFKRYKELFRIV